MKKEGDPPGTSLGEKIRARRDAMGMSQRELAARAGLLHGMVSKLERGRTLHSPSIAAICAVLETTQADLASQSVLLPSLPNINKPPRLAAPDAHVCVRRMTLMNGELVMGEKWKFPVGVLPAGNFGMVDIGAGRYLFCELGAAVTDGVRALLIWRQCFVDACVFFTVGGMRIVRGEQSTDLEQSAFDTQITVCGRIIGEFSRE